jgi:predicted ATPase
MELEGFRSIERMSLALDDRTILIGANGSGKSNLIGFFRLLGFMLGTDNGLATFTGLAGGASALLHDGPKHTPQITAHLNIRTGAGSNEYKFRLGYTADDGLIFLEEQARFSSSNIPGTRAKWIDLGAGHRVPGLLRPPPGVNVKTLQTIRYLLRGLRAYHFHDTSPEASIKRRWSQDTDRVLRADAGNLGAFLLRLRQQFPVYYYRIVETIRLVAPMLDDFVLESEPNGVLLRWRENGGEMEFGPHQGSDGTLRAMALVTLLLQPPDLMPSMIIIDEPELGLHPFAINIISGLVKAASLSCQCILATQSPQLLDAFEPADIVVAERHGRSSTFRRLPPESLSEWADEYTLSDLWKMNVLGGRPRPAAAE